MTVQVRYVGQVGTCMYLYLCILIEEAWLVAPVKLLEYIGTYYRYSSTSVPIRYKVPAYLKVKC